MATPVRYSESLLEDLVLLTLKNDGTVSGMSDLYRPFRIALRAALVLELLLQNRITVDPASGLVTLNTTPGMGHPEPLRNPLLAEALHQISLSKEQKTVTQWINHFWNGGIKQFRRRLLNHLVEDENEEGVTLLCRVSPKSSRLKLCELATRRRLANQLRYLLLTDQWDLTIYGQDMQVINVEKGESDDKRQQLIQQQQQQQQEQQHDAANEIAFAKNLQQQQYQEEYDAANGIAFAENLQQQQAGDNRYHFRYNDGDQLNNSNHGAHDLGLDSSHTYIIDAPIVRYERQDFTSFDSDVSDTEESWLMYPEMRGDSIAPTENDEEDGFDIVTDEEASEIHNFIEQKVDSLTSIQFLRLKFLVTLMQMDPNRFFPRIFTPDEIPIATQAAARITKNMPSVANTTAKPKSEGSSSMSGSEALEVALTVGQIAGVVLYVSLEVVLFGLNVVSALS